MLLGLVAERVGARVTRLIYLDALVPVAGDSALDLLPARARREVEVAARAAGGWRVPPLWPAAEFGITDQADRAWVDRRLTDQPLGTFMQPVGAASRQGIPRTYIACTAPRRETHARLAAAARGDRRWEYAELRAGHDAMVTAPNELAHVLVGALDYS